jgi:hypothetical protein
MEKRCYKEDKIKDRYNWQRESFEGVGWVGILTDLELALESREGPLRNIY